MDPLETQVTLKLGQLPDSTIINYGWGYIDPVTRDARGEENARHRVEFSGLTVAQFKERIGGGEDLHDIQIMSATFPES